MLSKKLAALAALSLMVGSSAAVAQSAQPLSLSNSPAIERAGAEAEGENRLESIGILPIIGVVVVVLAILALTDTWPFDDSDSP
jgi:hypothetical protein